jgi:hypothetical protein
MAEFKKGDRIVFTKDDAWWERGELVARMPAGTLGTYLGTDDDAPDEGAPWVRLDTGEHVLAWADVLAPVEDHGTGDGSASDICAEPGCNCDLERRFPAPLDPSKVKPGDTVTLRIEQGGNPALTLSGKTHTPATGYGVYLGGWRIDRLPDYATLTAHQPAPEPEPEVYTPDSERVRRAYVDARMDADIIGEEEAGAEFDRWKASLVVIDPADVDVKALTKVGDEAYLTDPSEFRHDGIQAAILAALAHLGIEVPR